MPPLNYIAKSDIGMRPRQEDCFCVCKACGVLMAVVCDGLGGHSGGGVASDTVCQMAQKFFLNEPPAEKNAEGFFKNLIKKTNAALVEIGRRTLTSPMTTVAICLFFEKNAYFTHLGDSRLYIFEGDKMVFHTKDHTALQEKLDSLGVKSSRHSNVLTKCLGGHVGRSIEVSSAEIGENTLFVLCSDGFWDNLKTSEIARLRDFSLADKIFASALQNGGAACDNATFVAVKRA
ncbi:MAG: serine/threonine-protein phosphatase [Opitutales bacterium]|nr:serine/threonine-protein phosphatase [Opitutales bacterium]